MGYKNRLIVWMDPMNEWMDGWTDGYDYAIGSGYFTFL